MLTGLELDGGLREAVAFAWFLGLGLFIFPSVWQATSRDRRSSAGQAVTGTAEEGVGLRGET